MKRFHSPLQKNNGLSLITCLHNAMNDVLPKKKKNVKLLPRLKFSLT